MGSYGSAIWLTSADFYGFFGDEIVFLYFVGYLGVGSFYNVRMLQGALVAAIQDVPLQPAVAVSFVKEGEGVHLDYPSAFTVLVLFHFLQDLGEENNADDRFSVGLLLFAGHQCLYVL